MIDKKVLTEVIDARARYESAKRDGMGVAARRTEYMNIVFSHADELIDATQSAQNADKQIADLNAQIDSLYAALESNTAKATGNKDDVQKTDKGKKRSVGVSQA